MEETKPLSLSVDKIWTCGRLLLSPCRYNYRHGAKTNNKYLPGKGTESVNINALSFSEHFLLGFVVSLDMKNVF